jgi:hypothetical protein
MRLGALEKVKTQLEDAIKSAKDWGGFFNDAGLIHDEFGGWIQRITRPLRPEPFPDIYP